MGSFRLRQGPQLRLSGISWRATLLGLVLGVALLGAAPTAARAAADLSVTATAAPEPVLRGDLLTYTITVQNAGPDPATQVTLEDELALGLSVPAGSLPAGCSMPTDTVVACDLGTIAPGPENAVSSSIVVRVHPDAPSAFTNTATVSSPDDTTPDNNSTEVVTTVAPSVDLGVTVTAVPNQLLVGELLTYSIEVHNKGPSPAANVTVTDTLPPGVSLVKHDPDCAESAPGTVTCAVSEIPVAARPTFNITVQTHSAGVITNGVSVASDTHEPEEFKGDNTASVDATVLSPPPVISGQGGGGAATTGPLEVVLTDSYVLISGRSVKLVKGRYVPVNLTCAGQRKCAGTITVSTAKRIATAKKRKKGKKPRRRIARLGSKKFSIESNRRQKVLVPLSKSKVKLLRRLKRVKAKASIREIDLKGNPRISTRTFVLRAR